MAVWLGSRPLNQVCQLAAEMGGTGAEGSSTASARAFRDSHESCERCFRFAMGGSQLNTLVQPPTNLIS